MPKFFIRVFARKLDGQTWAQNKTVEAENLDDAFEAVDGVVEKVPEDWKRDDMQAVEFSIKRES